jgi:hypothetical protein
MLKKRPDLVSTQPRILSVTRTHPPGEGGRGVDLTLLHLVRRFGITAWKRDNSLSLKSLRKLEAQIREMASQRQLCCWGYSGWCRQLTGLDATWNFHVVGDSRKGMTTLCSGNKPYRKIDVHCLKRDETQTTLLKRNRGKCQQLSPLPYIHFSILLKSTVRVFSHRITWKTFPIPFHMRSIFYVLKLEKQFSQPDLSLAAYGKLAVQSKAH